MTLDIRVVRADYANRTHAAALVALLHAYALDPMGGGEGLSDFAKTALVPALAARPQAFSVLAFAGADDGTPVGLVNCIEGFSTFACKPLVNVHDVAVLSGYRGQRIGERMLELVEVLARERGACKLTLEVLSGNGGAVKLYERVGFGGYALGSTMGTANFMQKWLR
ncbi:MAG: GNAT family N-acetyltransferase [Burkholderiales bacterium PBB3]|nr:MAG: GNAT family N-acetyltransferase [Burkholderiales bacterium PBB3]